MSSLIIAMIIVERMAFAVIGLLAAIYGQVLWSVFMGGILMVLIASTHIKVGGSNDEKNERR